MKPPKLNKLSKKELRKLYANQWEQNMVIVKENYKLSQQVAEREQYIKATENQVRIAENAMERMGQEAKIRIEEKEKILNTLSRVVNWNDLPIEEGQEYVIFNHREYQDMVVRIQSLERHNQNLMEEKENRNEQIRKISNWNVVNLDYLKEGDLILINESYFQEKMKQKEAIEKECYVKTENIKDLEEALSGSRQLRKSYQDLADKKHGEKNTIEKMARIAHKLDSGEKYSWEELGETKKDTYRVIATMIVSEDPDKE